MLWANLQYSYAQNMFCYEQKTKIFAMRYQGVGCKILIEKRYFLLRLSLYSYMYQPIIMPIKKAALSSDGP